MDRNHFAVWLDAYVEAWRSNDAAAIARLFSQDVRYFYGPYAEPVVGRDAVVASESRGSAAPDFSLVRLTLGVSCETCLDRIWTCRLKRSWSR